MEAKDNPRGSIWFDLKEFLPDFKIRCDMWFRPTEKWVLSEKDLLMKETPTMYNYLQKKWKEIDK